MRSFILSALAAIGLTAAAAAQPVLNAATLPNSRTADVDEEVAIFASVINSGDVAATDCSVGLAFGADSALTVNYAAADGSGVINGAVNTPVTIAAGDTQQFVVGVSASSAFNGAVPLTYQCANGQAVSATGLNDLALIATDDPIADIITIGSTLGDDGIMDAGSLQRGVLAVSALNIGDGDPSPARPSGLFANEASITVSGRIINFDTGGQFPIEVCVTDGGGDCQAPLASSVTTPIGDAPATIRADIVRPDRRLGFPFFPGEYRVMIEFHDSDGNLVGATSAAASSDRSDAITDGFGAWDVFARDDSDPGSAFTRRGRIFMPADSESLYGEWIFFGYIIREPFSGPEVQTFWVDGAFVDSSNPDFTRFEGCAHFFASGSSAAANPALVMTIQGERQLRAVWDTADAAHCALDSALAARGPDRPNIDVNFSSGVMYAAYSDADANDAPSDASRPGRGGLGQLLEGLLIGIFSPVDDVQEYGGLRMDLSEIGSMSDFDISGEYRGCNVTGDGNWDSLSLGARLNYGINIRLSYDDCAPDAEADPGNYEGYLSVDGFTYSGADVTGAFGGVTIYSDGFESGDSGVWSTSPR